MDFRERKEERTRYYLKYIYKWKQIKCISCNGSGYYDNTGSPTCGSCDGTGKESISPENYKLMKEYASKWGN